MTAAEREATVDVPEEWRRLGFSGLFATEAALDGPVQWFHDLASRAPCRLPLGTNGPWLLLRVDLETRVAVVVRDDAAAIIDLSTGRLR